MDRVVDVAQFIFDEYRKLSGEIIDEMKLHKLLYLSQRESLAIKGEPMFLEPFEGWKYGPVCVKVRTLFTDKGMYADDIKTISDDNAYIVKNMLVQYGSIESWKLSELSHNEISWKNARKGLQENEMGNKELSLEDIKEDAKKVRPYDSVWDMYYDEFEDYTL